MRIVLASASPRRIALIKKLSYLEAEVRPAGIAENTDRENPRAAVMDLAEQKARAVKASCLVLGADTVVVCAGRILGKPKTAAEADEMFRLLCGRTHSVLTGVCLLNGDKAVCGCEETFVEFGAYDEKVVNAYIASGKPFDKAGGYGLQDEELKKIVKGITGDYDNVLGLPVRLLDKLIRENFI